jgi:hypothetical protein
MKSFCGEIQYETKNGTVHSDICNHDGDPITSGYRKFLHDCLDEWLTQSEGTGFFWVGNKNDVINNFKEEENDTVE